jgi:hypothetical protein
MLADQAVGFGDEVVARSLPRLRLNSPDKNDGTLTPLRISASASGSVASQHQSRRFDRFLNDWHLALVQVRSR